MLNHFFSTYFSFTKKERIGVIVLITLIIGLFLFPFLFPFFIKEKKYDTGAFSEEISKLQQADSNVSENYYSKNKGYEEDAAAYRDPSSKQSAELFYFNPNTLDESGWRRLGVKDKIIQTIKNYLTKGGKFYKAEDLSKIWGFNPEKAKELIPYVKIENNYREDERNYPEPTKEKIKKELSVVDINTADTTAFIVLPGIGSKLANRIIAFREKLGGFYRVEQIAETFGLPDSTYQKNKIRFILDHPNVKQLNINNATLDELKSHPYIRYYLANAIVQYRTQHGGLESVDNLKKINLITDEIFDKISPYLKVN